MIACPRHSVHRSAGRRGAFTLIELLVVMGIIIVLATLTVISVGALARDARLTSAINTVKSALAEARALAMRRNNPVAVVFRVNWNPEEPNVRQFTEAHIVEWEETELFTDNNEPQVKDKYVPVPGTRVHEIPVGFKVAGPWYDFNSDTRWVTQPELRQIDQDSPQGGGSEISGRMIAVMFDSDGSIITGRSTGDTRSSFVDFNPGNQDLNPENTQQDYWDSTGNGRFFFYDEAEDEPNLIFVPFLAVYNDDEAREFYGDDDWNDDQAYFEELVNGDPNNGGNPALGYISEYADQIHFNRYTGVTNK